MSNDTKKKILEKAFNLFLEKGYDAVSISMIQKEVGIGRATMYHYFSSKQKLFETIIDMRYKMELNSDLKSNYEDIILSEYLKERIKKARLMVKHSKLKNNVTMLNYFVLSFQAFEKIPELVEKSEIIHNDETNKWKKVIENSIKCGEIANNTDSEMAAHLFMNIRHGIGVMATPKTSIEKSINKIEEMYNYIFSLLQ